MAKATVRTLTTETNTVHVYKRTDGLNDFSDEVYVEKMKSKGNEIIESEKRLQAIVDVSNIYVEQDAFLSQVRIDFQGPIGRELQANIVMICKQEQADIFLPFSNFRIQFVGPALPGENPEPVKIKL